MSFGLPSAPAELQIGITSSKPSLGQQYCDIGGSGAEASFPPIDEHVSEPRLERHCRDCAAMVGDPANFVQCAKHRQTSSSFFQRCWRRRIEEGEACRIDLAPKDAGEQQSRQIRFQDLGRIMRRKRYGRCFFPEANGDPRGLPRRSARALGHRRSACALCDEAGEACAAVVARSTGKAAVNYDTDVVERDARFGDAGCKNELALSTSGRRKGLPLRCRFDAAMQFVELDLGRKGSKRVSGTFDLGDAWKKRQQGSAMLGKRGSDRGRHLRLDPRGSVAAGITDFERETFAFAHDRRRIGEQTLK